MYCCWIQYYFLHTFTIPIVLYHLQIESNLIQKNVSGSGVLSMEFLGVSNSVP